ncbi:MAG: 2-dehydropantoate 2-reductase [Candidatus Lernaella stagnicola]|nr:2-dehydropantoate 2-reductase [Candidatus Lernaella stagnicola]
MRVAIVGAGAVGSLFAGLLAHGGHDVTLIERQPETVRAIRHNGLRLEGVRGDYRVEVSIQEKGSRVPAADLVMLCVKAYDTAAAVDEHHKLFTRAHWILSLQNGIGNIETIAARLGKDRLLAGSTTMGATLVEPGLCRHAGEGDTTIGAVADKTSPGVLEVADAFHTARIDTRAAADVGPLLWAKLCVNVAINPLAALLNVPNGRLADLPDLAPLMEAAVAETVAVARAEGVSLELARVIEKSWQVVADTAANFGSMTSDLSRGRRTEIDAICGAVVELGKCHDVPTPVNDMLARLIRAREALTID